MKTCLGCGRRMYVNNYCTACSIKRQEEYFENKAKENPNEKAMIDKILWNQRHMMEYRKMIKKESRQRYKDLYISERLRAKVRNALKCKTEEKRNSYNELIGCSINKLKDHLESKFLEGMTWDNYGRGGWHIDHIKPCQDFDLTNIEEQKKCFNYKNLQLLWAMDNFLKNGKHNRKRKK